MASSIEFRVFVQVPLETVTVWNILKSNGFRAEIISGTAPNRNTGEIRVSIDDTEIEDLIALLGAVRDLFPKRYRSDILKATRISKTFDAVPL